MVSEGDSEYIYTTIAVCHVADSAVYYLMLTIRPFIWWIYEVSWHETLASVTLCRVDDSLFTSLLPLTVDQLFSVVDMWWCQLCWVESSLMWDPVLLYSLLSDQSSWCQADCTTILASNPPSVTASLTDDDSHRSLTEADNVCCLLVWCLLWLLSGWCLPRNPSDHHYIIIHTQGFPSLMTQTASQSNLIKIHYR